jgi:hypothetical protein
LFEIFEKNLLLFCARLRRRAAASEGIFFTR